MTMIVLMARLLWLARLLDRHDEHVLVIAGSLPVIEPQRAFVTGNHGDCHYLDVPASKALAYGAQQRLPHMGAPGLAADHECFQDADLVAPLPRPGGIGGPDHGIAQRTAGVLCDQ